MLVLSRKADEIVVIGAGTEFETEVRVVSITDGRVRLGFTCPRSVTVHREEVQRLIDAKKADDKCIST